MSSCFEIQPLSIKLNLQKEKLESLYNDLDVYLNELEALTNKLYQELENLHLKVVLKFQKYMDQK